MAFRVGQKVECIAASEGLLPGETDAVVGHRYIVRAIFTFAGRSGIHLKEIRNPEFFCESGYHERFMWTRRFRPIVENKTDISIFTKMLTPEHVDA